jgi:streptomycin 6-kinase
VAVTSPHLPDAVLAMAHRGEPWADWVAALPAAVKGILDEWDLTPDGTPTNGYCSLVLPVRTAARRPAVLKIGFPDRESEHESLALQRWHGDGAVQLSRADPHRRALLLERLHHETLTDLWDLEACEVVAGLYGRLHIAAPAQLRRLSGELGRWRGQLQSLPRNAPVPRRLVEQCLAIASDLAADPDTDGRLVHGDLHYENVLAADREPWLAIDPKPLSGDPHFELAPMLWNRWDEVTSSGNIRDAVRRRFHTLVDAGGLDEHRARDWAVLRVVLNAVWVLAEAVPDADQVTRSVTIAKAVQD